MKVYYQSYFNGEGRRLVIAKQAPKEPQLSPAAETTIENIGIHAKSGVIPLNRAKEMLNRVIQNDLKPK